MRHGRFEAAQRGTIFLDEIGELSLGLQVKLLRVLQEHTFERLGSNQARPMQARVICATNRDLKTLAATREFRSDLYYRLNTIELQLPPLRERRDDIVMLAYAFLQKYGKLYDRLGLRLSRAATCVLKRYSWPGNVRELQHIIERAVLICEGAEIRRADLPSEVVGTNGCESIEATSFEYEVRTFKRSLIQRKLRETGNKAQVARTLKISAPRCTG